MFYLFTSVDLTASAIRHGNIFRVTGLCGGESSSHRWIPLTKAQSFDVFSDLRLHIRLSKQSRRWWIETPSRSLWRHCNEWTFFAVWLYWITITLGYKASWKHQTWHNSAYGFLLNHESDLMTPIKPSKASVLTRRSENDNTPQPLDQWTNSPFMGQQVGNCKSFTLAHSLAILFAMHCDPRESPSWIRHYIQLASLLFQVDQPSHS